jgi:hypothetical protein
MNAFTTRLATHAWALTVLAALASAAACSTMPDASIDVAAGLRPADTQAVFLEARAIGIAPTEACDAASVHRVARVPYAATYRFFGAKASVY